MIILLCLILVGLIGLAILAAISWLLQQWWFIPALILVPSVIVAAIVGMVVLRNRQRSRQW